MSEIQSTNSMPVEYRDVVGFPGYRVGDDGSIWTCLKRVIVHIGGQSGIRGTRFVIGTTWRRLKPQSIGLYPSILIGRKNSGRKNCLIHRLVLEAFVGPCPPGMQCCHFDGNTSNNRLSNLRWDTPEANGADRIAHGTQWHGERINTAKLTADQVRTIRTEYARGGITLEELGARYGITKVSTHAIVKRKNWKHVE